MTDALSSQLIARLESIDQSLAADRLVLLKNCGLEAAAMLCHKEDWHEAADRAGHNM